MDFAGAVVEVEVVLVGLVDGQFIIGFEFLNAALDGIVIGGDDQKDQVGMGCFVDDVVDGPAHPRPVPTDEGIHPERLDIWQVGLDPVVGGHGWLPRHFRRWEAWCAGILVSFFLRAIPVTYSK